MEKLNLKIVILTVSDRASKKTYEDLSGPTARESLEKIFAHDSVIFELKIVPDELNMIKESLTDYVERKFDFVFTTGGTGIGPRDVTPEATRKVIDKEIDGISEAMRSYSLQITKNAMLSCATAGISKDTLIINLPGSPKAVHEIIDYLGNTLKHAYYMMCGMDVH